MRWPRPTRSHYLIAGLLILLLVFAACGGGDDEPPATGAPSSAEETTPSEDEPAQPAEDLVVTGEPVAFQAASGVELNVPVGADGSCEIPQTSFDDQPDFFALCGGHFTGAGGDFLVAVISRETDRHDVGIFCSSGGDDYQLTASIIGTGTPVTQQLDFVELGEVAGMVLYNGGLSEANAATAVLVFQPEGAECPQFHGVGAVNTDQITPLGGLNGATVIGYIGPEGKLSTCTSVVNEGFVTKPPPKDATGCPAPGSD